jgi:hypothetical protein
VVGIDLQITFGLHLKIEEPVPGKKIEHMVQEGHAGVNLRPAFSVKVYRQPDAGFLGVSLDLATPHNLSPS